MPDLSPFAYNIVYNIMSFAVAAMGAATVFFFFAPRVAERYRPAMVVTGLVTFIACYHYFRILGSFGASFELTNGVYAYQADHPFNDFYRYADWLLTVPLLMVELIVVMRLAANESRRLLSLLIPATVLMIVTGYPGEAAISASLASGEPAGAGVWGWFVVSMFFFVATLGVLFTQLSAAIQRETDKVRGLINLARTIVLVTWSFYPVAYLIGAFGGKTAAGVIGLQVGYTIADITAKAGFGVVIYLIARAKTESEPAELEAPAPAVAQA